MKIKGLNKVIKTLEQMQRDAGQEVKQSVIVGYESAYAVYVHENLEAAHGATHNAKHKGRAKRDTKGKYIKGKHNRGKRPKKRGPNQQAKFLETPARKMQGELGAIIKNAVKNGAPLTKAMLMAGMRLQRASQKIVPVDTGNLKGSAFTKLE